MVAMPITSPVFYWSPAWRRSPTASDGNQGERQRRFPDLL